MSHPVIIQGGMGVAVSNWRLARTVSRLGELGVISGTLLAVILVRRLADGDPGGDVRRALAAFPIPGVAERVLEAHFIPGGKDPAAPYKGVSMPGVQLSSALTELTVAGNFVEVFLAKEGHSGQVGINLLEKIQVATLPSLYGAMLADVDYVLMGAGIPRAIPGALDRFAAGERVDLKIDVEGALPTDEFVSSFDPAACFGGSAPQLRRPQFVAIVSSATLALTLAKKSNGRVDGFVVEGDVAGGHNAPPRGAMQLDAQGEPIYGPRDVPDLAKIKELGLPFWLAGSQANPEKLTAALQLGAAGIQVGTAFAFCDESGIEAPTKREAIRASRAGSARVFTDPAASPTGFPFKIAQMPGTLSEPAVYAARERICDLGYLRQAYRKPDGTVGYRCAGEPVEDYVRKGGIASDTVGRKCLCNGLAATVGLPQSRGGIREPALVTAGNEISDLARLVADGRSHYSAEDVIRYLRGTSLPKACNGIAVACPQDAEAPGAIQAALG
ncbi:MAG: nitronate monooxygenase [Opitutaceae bacterium]|nr:nitronate monooxygenase [Opitutaceae bacterium]